MSEPCQNLVQGQLMFGEQKKLKYELSLAIMFATSVTDMLENMLT